MTSAAIDETASGYPVLPEGTDVRIIADALLAADRGAYGGAAGLGGVFRCPVHGTCGGDSHPSLHLAVGDSAPYILYCFVCADTYESTEFRNAVLESLNLCGRLPGISPMDDDEVDWGPRAESVGSGGGGQNWAETPDAWKQINVATYTYDDVDGQPKNRVVRDEAYDPKTGERVAKRLRPWHHVPDASPGRANPEALEWDEPGCWRWKLGWGHGAHTPMGWGWRDAWQGQMLHITEGEKDAERLMAEGLWATTYPFGDFPDDAETLKQHLGDVEGVVVYGDLDKVGFAKAQRRVKALKNAGYRVRTRFVDAARYEAKLGSGSSDKTDVSDWLGAGFALDEMVPFRAARSAWLRANPSESSHAVEPRKAGSAGSGRLVAMPLDQVEPINPRWLWEGLIPLGELTLLAGRQGIGKSTLAYQLAADVTTGGLRGVYHGVPRAVLVIATEDSTEHTIVPRLMAAGADRSRVHEIKARRVDGQEGVIDFGVDLAALDELIASIKPALILIDPLMSRLGALDTHKDSDVRQVLEPLVGLAHKHSCAFLGLIHLNKSQSTDPLTAIMGSVAFTAVARSVLFAVPDPTAGRIALGQPKSNLGQLHKGTLTFTVESAEIEVESGEPIHTARIQWGSRSDRTVEGILAEQQLAKKGKTKAEEHGEWIADYLQARPDLSASRNEVIAAGADEALSINQINTGFAWLKKQGMIESVRVAEETGPATWRLTRRGPDLRIVDAQADGEGEAY